MTMLADVEANHAGDLVDTLLRIRRGVFHAESLFQEMTVEVPEPRQESVRNLLHYLALRKRDVRPLQDDLARLGLSSLGRAESHVLASLDAVLLPLASMAGQRISLSGKPGIGFDEGRALLSAHTTSLLGPQPAGRDTRIMVTMPTEAAEDPDLIGRLIEAGMDVMRINLSHDDRAAWDMMLANRRRAEKHTGRTCRVLMDLAGPKLRTGTIEPGVPVMKLRPRRDPWGRVTEQARVWLTDSLEVTPPVPSADAAFIVPKKFLQELDEDGVIWFSDARDRRRTMTVATRTDGGALAVLDRTAYVVPGTDLRIHGSGRWARVRAEDVPRRAGSIRLEAGDLLRLTSDPSTGHPARTDGDGRVVTPATIGCTLPEVFRDVRRGEPVWFDDGKIGGVAEKVSAAEIQVRITDTAPRGTKLRAGRGINLPASELRLDALTAEDVDLLPFVVEHADLLGLSFVRTKGDVDLLQHHLDELRGHAVGILAKIETVEGFKHLPEILLSLMRWPTSGVMIARGDLAVEGGYQRLAELEEEILWLCEAAHLPAVWATQVLEGMAKTGSPSRAEITDAAMSARAECVMLNKGPYIEDTIRALDDILRRMREHQTKKQTRLRRLRSWYEGWPDV